MIKFDHMSLPVTNPEASRDWYVTHLGFRVEFEVPERRTIALIDDAGFTIFLYEAPGPLAGVRPALTLQVDNVDAKYATLVEAGLTFVNPPQPNVWGYGAELHDPDGYLLMLWDETTMREKSAPARR
jgi:catechol 2,3-dioxygenase-like lactoylglutathione lyase family enzyme